MTTDAPDSFSCKLGTYSVDAELIFTDNAYEAGAKTRLLFGKQHR
jgi:hypothetical protein